MDTSVSFAVPSRKVSWADESPPPPPTLTLYLNDHSLDFQTFSTKKRLGIRVFAESSVEPVTLREGGITLIFLGRLYYQDSPQGDFIAPDIKTIPKIYKKYGIEYLLKLLQGTFAFVLLDQSIDKEDSVLYVVTDVFGIIPLYFYDDMHGMYRISTSRKLNPLLNDLRSSHPSFMNPASYCSLSLSNKVNSTWKFENNLDKPSFHKYRILDGGGKIGQFPFSMIPEETDLVNTTLFTGVPNMPSYKTSIIQSLHYLLYCAVQKILLEFHQQQIICVGNLEDPEFLLIKGLLEKVLETTDFITIYIEDVNDTTLDYIKLRIQSMIGDSTSPVTIFMSSGLLLAEEKCRGTDVLCDGTNRNEMIMDYDARFMETLGSLVESWILPKLIEPLQDRNIQVEFPILEESWISFYISIFAKYRYPGYLLQRVRDAVYQHPS